MRRQMNRVALAVLMASLASLAGAGSASATILEVEGFVKDEKIEITASLKSGTSSILTRTDGALGNTCTVSHVSGSTKSPYIGATVTAPVSSLSFGSCERPVTVHQAGTLHVSHIAGTTNGTISTSSAEVTVGSPFGILNCKTGARTHIGTLTGRDRGNTEMHVNAVLNCGFLVPSASWKGTYTVTSPSGLGVTNSPPPPLPTTSLEIGGAPKGEKVEITSSLLPGTSSVLSRTDGSLANTCTASHVNGSSESPYHGAGVTGPISSLSFSSCERPVTVHKAGNLYVGHISGTTDGTVFSEEAEVTVGSPFGGLNCKTKERSHIGTLTGKKEGAAILDVNAVLNCGFLVPSASWKGTYTVTSPSGLGVTNTPPPVTPPSTTLEIGSAKQGSEVKVNASLKSGASSTLARTDGSLANICIEASVAGETVSPYTGETVTAPLSSLSFSSCTRPVTVHKAGTLHVEHIAGTTNGTVTSSGAEVTVDSPFGVLNCKTGEGTDIGTLTGSKESHATIDVDAVLDCGFIVPSATWKATYTVTSPTGLGVTD